MTSTESHARAWQFFIVLGLIGATAAVWREPRFTRPEHLVLLSLGIIAAAVAAVAMHRTLLPLVSPEQIVGDSRRSTRHLVALEREKRLVTMSTGQAGDADSLVGDLIVKTAQVEIETGGDVKTFAIQLRKYDVAPAGQTAKVMSRWLIQSITPQ